MNRKCGPCMEGAPYEDCCRCHCGEYEKCQDCDFPEEHDYDHRWCRNDD